MKERKARLAAMARLKDVQPELRDLSQSDHRGRTRSQPHSTAKGRFHRREGTAQTSAEYAAKKEKEFYLAAIHLAEKDLEAEVSKASAGEQDKASKMDLQRQSSTPRWNWRRTRGRKSGSQSSCKALADQQEMLGLEGMKKETEEFARGATQRR